MAITVGDLVVKLSGDTRQLEQAFKRSEKSLGEFNDSGKLLKVFAGALAGVTAAAVAMGLAAGRQAEELEHLSQITGVSADRLQDYQVLLNRTGLTSGDLTQAMRTLSTNMEQAQLGTGLAADRFRQLGIDITKVGSTDQLIRQIAQSVSKFSAGTQKAAIVADLLGRAGLRFIPAFQGGAKALDDMAAASLRLGEKLSGVQLQALTRMDDAVDDLGTAWGRFGQQLGAVVAPSIKFVVDGLIILLNVGSKVLKEMDTAADTLAIRFSHLALAINEVASVLFSRNVLSGEAWAQVAANLRMIDAEAAKLIAKRRDLAQALAPEGVKPPDLVDSAKRLAEQQALADAQLKSSQALFANEQALADAFFAKFQAGQEQRRAAGAQTDQALAASFEQATAQMTAFASESVQRQIANYETYIAHRRTLFAKDQAGQADLAKFEIESLQQLTTLRNTAAVAQVTNSTKMIAAATAVSQAQIQAQQTSLAVTESLATSELQILQARFADVSKLRAAGLAVVEATLARELAAVGITEEQKLAIYRQAEARRMEVAQQFPTFFQKQLQDLVASNVFALSQITTSFTSATAQWIVTGQNFAQFWTSLQVTIVQAFLNGIIQMAAEWLLKLSFMEGAAAAFEAARTAIFGEGEAARLVIAKATGVAMSAMMLAQLATIMGIGTAAIAVAVAVAETIAAIMFAAATAAALLPFGQPLAGALIAGATALSVGSAAAAVIGIGVIQAAAGAAILSSSLTAFAKGGIVTSPTLGLIGEAGPEAVVPLSRGGFGVQQIIHTHVYLDRRQIALAVSEGQPTAFRTMGVA